MRFRWLAGGAAVYALGTAAAYHYFYTPPPCAAVTEEERRRIFSANAGGYDDAIGWQETSSGIAGMRRRLVQRARGRVLEVGAGTGRNSEYYDPVGVERVTLVDSSEEMLRVAAAKAAAAKTAAAPGSGVPLAFAVADAARLPFADGAFDSAVSTFTLCSFEDPAAVLAELRRVVKPGGVILLLEHGRATVPAVTAFLQRHSAQHAARHGCYWDRPIAELVAGAGLRVVSEERRHLGTTVAFELANEPAGARTLA